MTDSANAVKLVLALVALASNVWSLPANGGQPYLYHHKFHPDARLLAPSFSLPVIDVDDIEEKYYEFQRHREVAPPFRTVAFFFPQFHRFKENDEFWGRGFTDWINVAKSRPMFEGHYQPRIPAHFGYYDLALPEVMEEQAELAKNYGISSFAYYFYWFNGRPVMEAPLKQMLGNPNVNISFCLTWANEDWTRRWDGNDGGHAGEVLLKNDYAMQDMDALFDHLLPYFRDDRYIKVDGKPMFVVYHAQSIPRVRDVVRRWRKKCVAAGFPGLYAALMQTRPDVYGELRPSSLGFDAAIEIPPHNAYAGDVSASLDFHRKRGTGKVYSYYETMLSYYSRYVKANYTLYHTSMLGWDNTARMSSNGNVFYDFSLRSFKRWNTYNMLRTLRSRELTRSRRFVFVNAWNEWAEGSHLEPDAKYGYGYLEAFYRAVSSFDDALTTFDRYMLHQVDPRLTGAAKSLCMVIHGHSVRATLSLFRHLSTVYPRFKSKFDIYLTTDSLSKAIALRKAIPSIILDIHENRGRDILPFIETIKSIIHLNYSGCLKVHGKETSYRSDGNGLRSELLHSLFPSASTVSDIVHDFKTNDDLGAIVSRSFLTLGDSQNMAFNWDNVKRLAHRLGIKNNVTSYESITFPAGSMLWLRPQCVHRLTKLGTLDFPEELGLSDGTLAHAVERVLLMLVKDSGCHHKIL